jgi:hypothetical protein
MARRGFLFGFSWQQYGWCQIHGQQNGQLWDVVYFKIIRRRSPFSCPFRCHHPIVAAFVLKEKTPIYVRIRAWVHITWQEWVFFSDSAGNRTIHGQQNGQLWDVVYFKIIRGRCPFSCPFRCD